MTRLPWDTSPACQAAPLLSGDSAPSLGTVTNLTKTATFSKKLFSAQLGALGGKPQAPQTGGGKEEGKSPFI